MANKRPPIKTRTYSSWRIDIDYWHKLNEEETQWLVAFLEDYYTSADPHSSERRDIVTLDARQTKTLLKPGKYNPSYTQDDYRDPDAVITSARQGPSDRDDESDELGAGG